MTALEPHDSLVRISHSVPVLLIRKLRPGSFSHTQVHTLREVSTRVRTQVSHMLREVSNKVGTQSGSYAQRGVQQGQDTGESHAQTGDQHGRDTGGAPARPRPPSAAASP